MGSVLRSVGASQGNIWTVAPFIPVGPSEKRAKKCQKRVFSKSSKVMIFLKPVPNSHHFFPKYGIFTYIEIFFLNLKSVPAQCALNQLLARPNPHRN